MHGGPTFSKYTSQKIASPSRKFLGETPWKVGLTVWVSHGCLSTYPTFFGGPNLRNRLRTQKETETKKPLTTLQTHTGCVSNFPQKMHPLRTEKQLAPPLRRNAGPEIRWDHCVPGNDVAPPVASKEPRGWRPTGLVLGGNRIFRTQQMPVFFFFAKKLKM